MASEEKSEVKVPFQSHDALNLDLDLLLDFRRTFDPKLDITLYPGEFSSPRESSELSHDSGRDGLHRLDELESAPLQALRDTSPVRGWASLPSICLPYYSVHRAPGATTGARRESLPMRLLE